MTDELITELAKISALEVISRTSSMHYKGANVSLPQIARALGVDAVVEGTVMRAGDRVRITAQLIAALAAAPMLAGFAGTDVFLPMVGRQAGIFPSDWYTTVWIYDPRHRGGEG